MNKKHGSGVFMMEMIAVVFFFILCAAICIQTFVKADGLSRKAANLNQGVFIAQSVAEVWKAEGREGLEQRFLAENHQSGDCVMKLYKDGTPVADGEAVYTVTIPFENGEDGMTADITVSSGKETVYTLQVKRH